MLLVGLLVMFTSIWLLIFLLRALGGFLFIALPQNEYQHLTTNKLLNQGWFLFPALLWIFAVSSWIMAWPDEVKKLPRRDKLLRSQRYKALIVRHVRGFALLNVLCFLLALPGMRSFTIVTQIEIRDQSFYAAQAEVYPLKQLACIERSVSSRGAIFQTLYFIGGGRIVVSGLNPAALLLIQRGSGLANPWLVDCKAHK